MTLREITSSDIYNQYVTHVIQSWEWGEFRQSLGTQIKRFGIFQGENLLTTFTISFHPIPKTSYLIGYIPKGPFPDKDFYDALIEVCKLFKVAFIKMEPNIPLKQTQDKQVYQGFRVSPKPLFTKYNFVLDITPTEEELLAKMHQKTRYNIRLATKKGVVVQERTDDAGLEDYLNLYFETTARQKYHGHNREYHRAVWKRLTEAGMARLLIGYYEKKPLTAWMLLNFKDVLYYPYGGSSNEHRDVMSSNLVAWEAIKLGKRMNLQSFDMWGALGPDANPKDPWFGFHRFKQGYGGELVEYIGTFDLVLHQPIYQLINLIERLGNLKFWLLKLFGK